MLQTNDVVLKASEINNWHLHMNLCRNFKRGDDHISLHQSTNKKTQTMVKPSNDTGSSNDKVKTKRARLEEAEDQEVEPLDMTKVLTDFEDDTNYDKYVSKTFVADDIEPPRLVEYLTKGGVTVMQDVVNIYITDPTGVRRVITVWGKNSYNIYDSFK